ncbi:MAG: hypothetical protein M1833_007238 [Piccolia ochrophora]|nr:MAG: hypothetical protein M1833_007238 [Piccolia ochrophora]
MRRSRQYAEPESFKDSSPVVLLAESGSGILPKNFEATSSLAMWAQLRSFSLLLVGLYVVKGRSGGAQSSLDVQSQIWIMMKTFSSVESGAPLRRTLPGLIVANRGQSQGIIYSFVRDSTGTFVDDDQSPSLFLLARTVDVAPLRVTVFNPIHQPGVVSLYYCGISPHFDVPGVELQLKRYLKRRPALAVGQLPISNVRAFPPSDANRFISEVLFSDLNPLYGQSSDQASDHLLEERLTAQESLAHTERFVQAFIRQDVDYSLEVLWQDRDAVSPIHGDQLATHKSAAAQRRDKGWNFNIDADARISSGTPAQPHFPSPTNWISRMDFWYYIQKDGDSVGFFSGTAI